MELLCKSIEAMVDEMIASADREAVYRDLRGPLHELKEIIDELGTNYAEEKVAEVMRRCRIISGLQESDGHSIERQGVWIRIAIRSILNPPIIAPGGSRWSDRS